MPRAGVRAAASAVVVALTSMLLGCAGASGPASPPPPDAEATAAPPAAAATAAPQAASAEGAPTLIAHAALPPGTTLEGLEVGGLSDLEYDARRDLFWAVVDDVPDHPPARLLSLRWHPPAPPEPLGWLLLLEADGTPLAAEGADLEGLVLTPEGGFVVSSEGWVDSGIAPWVGRFDSDGRLRGRLDVPHHLRPGVRRGARNNAGFEALTLLPDGRLLAGVEAALLQDDPTATGAASDGATLVRLLRWSDEGGLPDEWVAAVEPSHARAPLPGGLRVNGLVDVLPMPGGSGGLLTLERSFVAGALPAFRVRLFATELAAAAQVTGRDSLAAGAPEPPPKRLVLDLADLGVAVDNYEALAWGPPGPDGAATLVVTSDNNFSGTAPSHWLALRWPG